MKEDDDEIIFKFDKLKITSLKDINEAVEEAKAKKKLKDERELFNDFIETGKVKPFPSKPDTGPQMLCQSTKMKMGLHQQTVRKMSIPKNPKRKFTI